MVLRLSLFKIQSFIQGPNQKIHINGLSNIKEVEKVRF